MERLEERIQGVFQLREAQEIVRRSVAQLESGRELAQFLTAYVQFNQDFSGGVTSLVAAIQHRADLFRDSSSHYTLLADRSGEVAGYVFFAAIDEFWDRTSGIKISHRQLAQAFLEGVLSYYEILSHEFGCDRRWAAFNTQFSAQVNNGYLRRQGNLSDVQIFEALGFHIGSELSGAAEYSALDEFLRMRCPELVFFLKQQLIVEQISRYDWISSHIQVEVEHNVAALKAAKEGLRFYVGQGHSVDDLEDAVIAGVMKFKTLLADFFHHLLRFVVELGGDERGIKRDRLGFRI